MPPSDRKHPCPSPNRAAGLIPWALGAVIVALLVVFLDESVGRWCLANREVPPMPQLQKSLGYTGAGGVQGPLLLAALLGGATCSARGRRVLGALGLVLALASAFAWPTFAPDGKDAVIALLGLPGLFLIAWACAGLVHARRADRGRYLAVCRWLLLTFVVATVLTTGIKYAVRRPRPAAMDLPRPSLSVQIDESAWHSFPSGDVLVTTALVMVLWGMVGRPHALSWLFAFPAIAMVQRLAAAKHFPGDVAGGLLLGLLIGDLMLAWVRARGWRASATGSDMQET